MSIVDVVKYNGSPRELAWKFPEEALSTWTQLIVNESQEAILFKEGRALDVFTSGRHTLDTDNIPLLQSIINLPFGGKSPFTAEVWFINKRNLLDIKWGTPSPIQVQDPKYGLFIPIRSFGQFGIKITDSHKFLTQVVGTLPSFDTESLASFFKGIYTTKVKDCISSYLVVDRVSVVELNAHLEELSEFLQSKMQDVFDNYGIELLNFFVNDISIPENDPAVIKLKEALARRAEMDIVGFNYNQERTFNALEGAAKNPGSDSSGLMGAGIGLSMGTTMGKAFGDMLETPEMKDTSGSSGSSSRTCQHCNAKMNETDKFCPECGKQNAKKGFVLCSACNAQVKEGQRFCHECGTSLVAQCSQCGAVLPANARFCSECGHSAAPINE